MDGHSQFIFEHVAPACGNLCRALGEDFAMFLPVVLPPLFAALEEEVKFSMEAADLDDDGEVRSKEACFGNGTFFCGVKLRLSLGASLSAYYCIPFFLFGNVGLDVHV